MTKMTKAKKAKKAAAKSKAAEKPKDFQEHLDELYSVFGPNLDEVPPPDLILSAASHMPPTEFSFDQLYAVNMACMYRIKEIAESGDHMGARILTEEAVRHFVEWLKPQSLEFQVLCLRSMLCIFKHKHIDEAIFKQTEFFKSVEPIIKTQLENLDR